MEEKTKQINQQNWLTLDLEPKWPRPAPEHSLLHLLLTSTTTTMNKNSQQSTVTTTATEVAHKYDDYKN